MYENKIHSKQKQVLKRKYISQNTLITLKLPKNKRDTRTSKRQIGGA